MKSKIYQIKTELAYEKVCYATLKKVFSVTLFPRVLLNIQNPVFDKIFSEKLDFECFFTQKFNEFSKKTHIFDFDIGIFFFEKDKSLFIKLIDGNGLLAGSFVTNIFDKVMNMSQNEFEVYKKQIDDSFSKLDKNKLLHENI